MGTIKYTYSELKTVITHVSKKMDAIISIKNMKVGISVSNPIDFVIFALAIIHNQGIVIPIYDKIGEMKLHSFLEKYDINVYISSKKHTQENGTQIYLNSNSYTFTKLSCEIDPELDDIALMMLTSGTTNIPKLAMLSIDNIYSNINGISEYLSLTTDDKVLIVKSHYHISTLVGEIMVALYNSCSLVFSASLPTFKSLYRIINQENITVFFAVASLLNGLLDTPVTNNKMRILNFYGSTFPAVKMKSLFKTFPYTDIIYSYGLTEASPRVTYIHRNELVRRISSSGKALSEIRLNIYNEYGISQEPGQIGEIVVEGPNVFKGYYMNNEQTSKTLRNGQLYTGDLGYIDAEGYLYVTGRKDNMVIISGKNVFPEEIESVINQYPGVSETLVCKKDTLSALSNKFTAFIVESTKGVVNIPHLLQHCRLYLEDYKIPSEIIIKDRLEKTVSGKIMRFNISEEV